MNWILLILWLGADGQLQLKEIDGFSKEKYCKIIAAEIFTRTVSHNLAVSCFRKR